MSLPFIPAQNVAVLVVGDVILDRYVHGVTTRISPEAPVPIVRVQDTEDRPGGAGNVALNIARLGVGVCLVGITGDDPAADTLARDLSANGVECEFFRQAGFPTLTKLRIISQHQQLLRLDYETPAEPSNGDNLFNLYRAQLDRADIVVLSDYAKGSLVNVEAYIAAANHAGRKVLVDPKGADFTRYRGASLLTPNLKEFEAVAGVCGSLDELVTRGREMCQSLMLEALLITRGEHGMTLLRRDEAPLHLEAQAREVFDVTGAGDTVIATLAAALASRYDFTQATALANRAAGLVVAKLGTATVSVEELNHALDSEQPEERGVLEETRLREILGRIRRRGETIVMTNGCFDILHAGHVAYLQQARQLGDHLLVAVNDDASVRRLKGAGRPVTPLPQRLAVLSALKPVDWVIPFSEDTPERLICDISPDVLVKGGDYRPDEIAGADCVRRNGGKIHIIPLLADCSTSRIVGALQTGRGKRR